MRHRTVSTVVGLLFLSGPVPAQPTLSGIVREDSSLRVLAGVEVLLEGTKRQTTTDASGRFRFGEVRPGPAVLLFRFVGYRPARMWVSVREDTTGVEAVLVRHTVQRLEAVEVTGRPAAPRGIGRESFEERRRMGLGKFIDSTELRRREHSRVSDVLRGIPGLNLVKFRPCPRGSYLCEPEEFRAASGRGEVSLGRMYRDPEDAYCWMSVILDGSYLYRSGSGRSGRPPDFGKDFRVADLESIEVYRSSAELPPEFGGTSGACGTVVLWSRRG